MFGISGNINPAGSKKIYIHIGTHKTGSSAIQAFLDSNRGKLNKLGFDLYRGSILRANHIELYLAAMRAERDSFARVKMKLKLGPAFIERVRQRVANFLRSARNRSVVMTTEGLSLLRYDDEIDRLRTILDAETNDVAVILCLRDRARFLESYKRQILRGRGRKFSDDARSVFYVQPDTWLTDYPAIIKVFRRGFGDGAVTVIDYDAEMQRRGDIRPAFVEALGLAPDQFAELGEQR